MKKPNLKPNDIHVVISHSTQRAKVFKPGGQMVFQFRALTSGVAGGMDEAGGDTPFGLYEAGEITETLPTEDESVWRSFGPWFVDLVELEEQERKRGRAGIGFHGGRQGRYAPDPRNSSKLWPTHGCVRVQDETLDKKLIPMFKDVKKAGGRVYLTVTA